MAIDVALHLVLVVHLSHLLIFDHELPLLALLSILLLHIVDPFRIDQVDFLDSLLSLFLLSLVQLSPIFLLYLPLDLDQLLLLLSALLGLVDELLPVPFLFFEI